MKKFTAAEMQAIDYYIFKDKLRKACDELISKHRIGYDINDGDIQESVLNSYGLSLETLNAGDRKFFRQYIESRV